MSWQSQVKARNTLFQLELQPYLDKAKQTFPDIQKRAEYARLRAQTAIKFEDKRFFKILAESYTYEKIAQLNWFSDTERFYENYRRSLLWKEIREAVIQRDKYQCQGCGWRPHAGHKRSYNLHDFEVHHKDYKYETMVGIDHGGLITLCCGCHKYIHWEKGVKRPEYEWASALQRLQEHYTKKRQESRKKTRLLNQLKKLIEKSSKHELSAEEQLNKATFEQKLRSMKSYS